LLNRWFFSAALQEGFIFLTFIGILTSLLVQFIIYFIVKTMFFDLSSYKYFNKLQDIKLSALFYKKNKVIERYIILNLFI